MAGLSPIRAGLPSGLGEAVSGRNILIWPADATLFRPFLAGGSRRSGRPPHALDVDMIRRGRLVRSISCARDPLSPDKVRSKDMDKAQVFGHEGRGAAAGHQADPPNCRKYCNINAIQKTPH
jgi:hypothetical protein